MPAEDSNAGDTNGSVQSSAPRVYLHAIISIAELGFHVATCADTLRGGGRVEDSERLGTLQRRLEAAVTDLSTESVDTFNALADSGQGSGTLNPDFNTESGGRSPADILRTSMQAAGYPPDTKLLEHFGGDTAYLHMPMPATKGDNLRVWLSQEILEHCDLIQSAEDIRIAKGLLVASGTLSSFVDNHLPELAAGDSGASAA